MNQSAIAGPRKGGARALGFLSVALCAWATSGCFGLQARVVTAPQPLDMPEPPPRVVEVHEPEMPPPVSLPEEPVRNTPPRARSTPPAATDTPRAPEPPKADPPVDVARPADDTVKPPTTLQTTPAQQEGEVERRIRTLLSTAMNVLNRINYQALNPDARTQYDTAKRFVSQAEEALRAKNLVFANNLADKAAALASQLGGR